MSLKWEYDDDDNSEWATFEVGGLEVFVMDQDGDQSEWSIKIEGKIESGFLPYHFDAAKEKAEVALREIAAKLGIDIPPTA